MDFCQTILYILPNTNNILTCTCTLRVNKSLIPSHIFVLPLRSRTTWRWRSDRASRRRRRRRFRRCKILLSEVHFRTHLRSGRTQFLSKIVFRFCADCFRASSWRTSTWSSCRSPPWSRRKALRWSEIFNKLRTNLYTRKMFYIFILDNWSTFALYV